ncbi:MAG: dTMP kinase [Chloroflexi bacterium]|nr:dTMP kinase [Chloroflexota bacterium]
MVVGRGLFIVLEGPDGAGISTQTALLRSGLAGRGIKAIETKEPTAGPVGSVIRQALSHRLVYPPSQPVGDDVLALLLAADRLDHLRADIVPRLEGGTHVICDRYRLSSYAYQGNTLGQEWVQAINSRSIAPDITFFLDAPPEVSQARIAHRGQYIELYESEERLRPIYANYRMLVDEMRRSGEEVVTVDATLAVGVVAATILEKTLRIMAAKAE